MKVIIVYDINIQRVDIVRQILKQYLSWIQNSVFEGEISFGTLEELKTRLKKTIDIDTDSIIIYTINNPVWVNKFSLGREKGTTNNII